MVTGDHPQTAEAIAREIGLVRSENPVVITGTQLGHLSNIQLQLALDAPEILFARVQAEQKMRIVAALKKKREIVAVTGDGVNDAPALRKADVGIAMGLSGTEVAREAADMVLLDDNFASIVAAIEEGRAVFSNIRNFLTYILTSNVPEIIPYLAFVILPHPSAAHHHPDSRRGSGHRHAASPRPGRRKTRARHHEIPAPPAHRPLAEPAAAHARLSVPRPDAGDRRDVRLRFCPALRRLDIRTIPGRPRSTLPAIHHRLPQRHRGHANRQRFPLPKRSRYRCSDAAFSTTSSCSRASLRKSGSSS